MQEHKMTAKRFYLLGLSIMYGMTYRVFTAGYEKDSHVAAVTKLFFLGLDRSGVLAGGILRASHNDGRTRIRIVFLDDDFIMACRSIIR